MTTIDVLNPEYETDGPDEILMAARSTLVEPVVITVIENSKPHAKELLTTWPRACRNAFQSARSWCIPNQVPQNRLMLMKLKCSQPDHTL